MNRHQRRAARRIADGCEPGELLRVESQGLVQIDVLPVALLRHHEHGQKMTTLARQFWIDVSPQNEQFCLACDHKWTYPQASHPPAGFMFARSWRHDAFIWMVVGICEACLQLGPFHLKEHTSKVMSSRVGSGTMLDGSHRAHEVLQ
jgi:hypothetical protein